MTSTELKHQAQLAKWTELIKECRSSGLPVKTWCQQAQITPSTYYRWERNVLASAETFQHLPLHSVSVAAKDLSLRARRNLSFAL